MTFELLYDLYYQKLMLHLTIISIRLFARKYLNFQYPLIA